MITVSIYREGHGFVAEMDGRRLCEPTDTPLLNAARVLLSEGFSPDEVVGMVHRGSDEPALTARIGEAAKLTVKNDMRSGPVFVLHVESTRTAGVVAASESPATTPADASHDARLRKGEAAWQRIEGAWLDDHPGQTVDDFDRVSTCAATDAEAEAFGAWCMDHLVISCMGVVTA
jgi:hypothetical protein